MTKMRATTLAAAAAMLLAAVAGCSGERVVNTGEAPATPPPQTPPAPPTTPPSNAHLVDAFDYVAHPQGSAVYYFTSPSGRWACAIVPRIKAGCQSAAGWQSSLAIEGAPTSVADTDGAQTTPNAVVVEREGEPRFVAVQQPEFQLDTANELPFNRILAAAGFRCNVQEESGIACLSEFSGKGFTFDTDGYTPLYTDVPANAP